jgi:hypothetical protein
LDGSELAAWIGVGITSVGLIVTIAVARYQRRRKVLAYTANMDAVLVGPRLFGSDIQILVAGRVLRAPHVVVLTIRNVGNEEVCADDFERPLRMHLPGVELVDCRVRSDVADLSVKVAGLEGGGIEIEPLLLNPGEGFALTALLDGRADKPRIEARIAGTKICDETRVGPVSMAVLGALGDEFPTCVPVMLLGAVRSLLARVAHPSRRRVPGKR